MKTQPKLIGKKRIPTHSSLESKLRKLVEREADYYDCSKAFVMTVALAYYFDIKLDYYYR